MANRENDFRLYDETVMMLGKFNPWTSQDTEVFKRAITKTSQVAIMIRAMRETPQTPYTIEQISNQIRKELTPLGFFEDKHYVIGEVPNIVTAFTGPAKDYQDEQDMLDTMPPDNKFKVQEEAPELPSVFKTANLSDPWAGAKTKEELDAEKDQDEGSITNSDMKHEDWPEG